MATKKLYCIAGASASGKTTVVDLLKNRYKVVKSYTTRKPRFEGEASYHFVTPEEFADKGQMYAYAVYDGNEYGVPKMEIDTCDIYIVEPVGIEQLRRLYSKSCNPEREVFCIYLNVSEDLRRARMENRGDSPETIENRIAQDNLSFRRPAKFANIVIRVTEDMTPENIAGQIAQIIAIEEARAATKEVVNKYKHIWHQRSGCSVSINCVRVDDAIFNYMWACDSVLSPAHFDDVNACIASLEEYMNERAALILTNKVTPNCRIEREFYEMAVSAILASAQLNAGGDRSLVFNFNEKYSVDVERMLMGYRMLWNRYTDKDIRNALDRGHGCIEEMDLRGEGLDLLFDKKS